MAQQVEALEFQRIGEIEDMIDLVEIAVAMDAPRQVRRMAMSGQIQRDYTSMRGQPVERRRDAKFDRFDYAGIIPQHRLPLACGSGDGGRRDRRPSGAR